MPRQLTRFFLLFLTLPVFLPSLVMATECPPIFSTKFGSRGGSGPGQFSHPLAGVTDLAGNLFVVDSGNNRIQKFAPDGTFLLMFGSFGSGPGQFNAPAAIARDGSGNLYVADTGNNRIQKLSASGSWLATIGGPGIGSGQFQSPRGVAVTTGGKIIVADTGNNRIQRFAADGMWERLWGPGTWEITIMTSVATAPGGQIYVLDTRNGQVFVWDEDGHYVTEFNTGFTSPNSLFTAQMCVDASERLHMPNGGSCGRIDVLDSSGGLIYSYGSGTDCIMTHYGGGVATDASGNAYIIDNNWYRIYKFSPPPNGCDVPPPPPPPWVVSEPKILLHIGDVTTKNVCTVSALPDCRSVKTKAFTSTASGPFYYVYLIAARGPVGPLGGVQCGITYQNGDPGDEQDQVGVDVFGWTLCADLQFISTGDNQWPKPGGGNLITWSNCQSSQLAVAGFFYVAAYNPDEMRVIARPVDGLAKVATCESAETEVSEDDLGKASFATSLSLPGCNPCLARCDQQPVPVRLTTWSGVKSLYRE